MPPQKILNFMGALRCFLVHFGAGVLTGITNTTQQKEDYRNSIELSGKSSCSILTTEYGIILHYQKSCVPIQFMYSDNEFVRISDTEISR